jgi:hypothetical protein
VLGHSLLREAKWKIRLSCYKLGHMKGHRVVHDEW